MVGPRKEDSSRKIWSIFIRKIANKPEARRTEHAKPQQNTMELQIACDMATFIPSGVCAIGKNEDIHKGKQVNKKEIGESHAEK